MPYTPRTAENTAKIVAGNRHRKFDRIADPLWHAIHHGRAQEVGWLMAELTELVANAKWSREHRVVSQPRKSKDALNHT